MNTTNSFALIFISVGLFFLLGNPALSDIELLKAEKVKYNDAIAEINLLESKKNELLAKLNNIPAEERERLETFLPTRESIIRLVADIDGVASKHDIAIDSANLGEVRNDLSRGIMEAPKDKAYNSKIIDLTFAADYDDLTAFLVDLEESLRIIDIRTIDFTTTTLFSGKNQYKVSMEVYWLKDLQYEKQ